VFLPLAGLVDVTAESRRIGEELVGARQAVIRLEQLLENGDFVARAPANVVEQNRAKLAETRERVTKLESQLAALG
jgi:valyl-tRNA synthetase